MTGARGLHLVAGTTAPRPALADQRPVERTYGRAAFPRPWIAAHARALCRRLGYEVPNEP